jgi:hypothetical protein
MDLVVGDFDEAEKALRKLVNEYDGYIANARVSGKSGTRRSGHWTLRVPAARYEKFLADASELGELQERSSDSNDVTDAYYDMAAEVKNLEAREEALRKLYKEKIAGTKLADLLDVDREVTKVRGEINVRKGRLARWDKETRYTTITLSLEERGEYTPEGSPAFDTRLGRTFQSSVNGLIETGKFLLMVVVALAPWLPILLVVGVPVWLRLRRRSKPPTPAGEGARPGVT